VKLAIKRDFPHKPFGNALGTELEATDVGDSLKKKELVKPPFDLLGIDVTGQKVCRTDAPSLPLFVAFDSLSIL
jgi:hypothetical protein